MVEIDEGDVEVDLEADVRDVCVYWYASPNGGRIFVVEELLAEAF